MARVPIDLIRRGIDMGPQKPSKYELIRKRLFETRRRLHLRLRDLTEDDLRKVNMCTFESMMLQLWREGHIWTGAMMTEFVELDKVARKICSFVAPQLRRMSLKKEKKLMRLLADELCEAEDARNEGRHADECEHLLYLAAESAAGGASWWWLTERLLREAAATVGQAGDTGEKAAQIALATGAYLLDQLHESGEAVVELTKAMRLSRGSNWVANVHLMMGERQPSERVMMSPTAKPNVEGSEEHKEEISLDCGTDEKPATLFECASAVLCRALIQEARRARLGCVFGVTPGKKARPQTTKAKNPTSIKGKGNPFKEQVSKVDVQVPRVLTEKTKSATSEQTPDKKLDFIAILNEDLGEPDIQDPSNVDSGSAAGFCREAAQHARNADRRDLEESALIELGKSLQSGGAYEGALEPFQIVLELFKDDNNSAEEIKTNFQLALCYRKMGNYNNAHTELQTALYRAQETGDRNLIYTAHKYLGMFFLKTTQRRYATTHFALALLAMDDSKNFTESWFIRSLVGVAGANELMAGFVSLLRSTESSTGKGKESMAKLQRWKGLRTPFWPPNLKVSAVLSTLEMALPSEGISYEDSGEKSTSRAIKNERITVTADVSDTLQDVQKDTIGPSTEEKQDYNATQDDVSVSQAETITDAPTKHDSEKPPFDDE